MIHELIHVFHGGGIVIEKPLAYSSVSELGLESGCIAHVAALLFVGLI